MGTELEVSACNGGRSLDVGCWMLGGWGVSKSNTQGKTWRVVGPYLVRINVHTSSTISQPSGTHCKLFSLVQSATRLRLDFPSLTSLSLCSCRRPAEPPNRLHSHLGHLGYVYYHVMSFLCLTITSNTNMTYIIRDLIPSDSFTGNSAPKLLAPLVFRSTASGTN